MVLTHIIYGGLIARGLDLPALKYYMLDYPHNFHRIISTLPVVLEITLVLNMNISVEIPVFPLFLSFLSRSLDRRSRSGYCGPALHMKLT